MSAASPLNGNALLAYWAMPYWPTGNALPRCELLRPSLPSSRGSIDLLTLDGSGTIVSSLVLMALHEEASTASVLLRSTTTGLDVLLLVTPLAVLGTYSRDASLAPRLKSFSSLAANASSYSRS